MKKLFFVVAIVGSACIVRAQDQISFGPKAGANFASWATKEVPELKMRTAFHAGGVAIIPVSRTIALQPELLYSKEGTKFGDMEYDISYLNIPLLVRYQHASGFHAETGPQLGILLDAQSDSDEQGAIKEYIRSTQGSWCVGMGYQFKFGLDLHTRYNIGISRAGASADKVTGNVLSVGVAYMFKK